MQRCKHVKVEDQVHASSHSQLVATVRLHLVQSTCDLHQNVRIGARNSLDLMISIGLVCLLSYVDEVDAWLKHWNRDAISANIPDSDIVKL